MAYITCPRCRRQIREPFSRTSGPVPYVHGRPHRSACRLIVFPDPNGDKHQVVIVPDDVRLEEALLQALQKKAA